VPLATDAPQQTASLYSITSSARASSMGNTAQQKDRPVAAFRISGFRQPFRLQEFGTILRPNAWRICRKLPEQRTAAPDHSIRY
jgi:hypothetical protein